MPGRSTRDAAGMISSLFHLARTARVGFVLAREGALALVDPSVLPPLARAAIRLGRADRAARAPAPPRPGSPPR